MRLRPLHPRQGNNLQAHPQNIPRIPGINNPIINQHRASRVTLRIALSPLPKLGHLFLQLLRRQHLSLALGTSCLHILHNARQLVWAHDAASASGPGEQETGLVGASAHGVVAGSVGGAEDDGDVGDC